VSGFCHSQRPVISSSNEKHDGQYADAGEGRSHCHRADDVSGDKKLEPEQDGPPDLAAVGLVARLPAAQPASGVAGRDDRAQHDNRDTDRVYGLADHFYDGLEVHEAPQKV
jgi:hypothetical protein